MNGARPRHTLWLAFLASLLVACTPVSGPEATVASAPASVTVAEPTATSLSVPQPTSFATPPSPVPTALSVPGPEPFAANLYREGDFVPQYTFDWCVAASIQMAHNLVDDTGGATWSDAGQQSELWEMARARSSDSFNGANPFGWAEVLTASGMGPYSVVSVADFEDALRTAARALAGTGRPVGLVMWSGRHAWVMSGFESIGDPGRFRDFQVTGIRVLDPLFPYGSEQWGPSPAPNSLLTPGELATQFVVRQPRRWSSGLPAGYLLVLPQPAQ